MLETKTDIFPFLISPSILAVLIFIYGFIAWSVRVSLSDWKGLVPDYTWAGLSNYINLFSDPAFWWIFATR
jgi:glucose/mannose transport system permease protein